MFSAPYAQYNLGVADYVVVIHLHDYNDILYVLMRNKETALSYLIICTLSHDQTFFSVI